MKMASGLKSNINLSNKDKMFEDSPGNLVNSKDKVQDTDNDHSANAINEQDDNVNEYRKKLRSHVRNVNTVNDEIEWQKNFLNETV